MMRIGTRGSDLALWQARFVQASLGGEATGVTLDIIRTRGDQLVDLPLQAQLDKGFFTKELEVALLDGRIDLAVHSLKDLPTELPAGLVLAAVPTRADAGDVLFVHPSAFDPDAPLHLRSGARVGTSSMRRTALLQHVAPQAEAVLLRGNVPTRLRKCIDGELDAVLLARAGVARLSLDFGHLHAYDLAPQRWLPAAAQGALGLQARVQDPLVVTRVALIHDAATAQAVALERGLLRRVEGGCHSAFGALATVASGTATLRAGLTDAAGTWRAILVTGPVDSLVETAFSALQTALAADGATSATEAGPWISPARPWR